jgi:hypothetical protein
MENETVTAQDPAQAGAEVLDSMVRVLKRFLYFSRPEHYDLVALWALHTWVYKVFRHTPRLDFSGDRGTGKTLSVEITGLMSRDAYQSAGMTGPALRIKVHRDKPTLALDEVDVLFGATGRRHEDQRAILNSGYREDGAFETAVGNGTDTKRWETFTPVMFAGIGSLPQTLADRSFVITMTKPPKGTRLTRYHSRLHESFIRATGQAAGEWARSVAPEMSDIIPEEVPGVEWRGEDIAEPLLVLGEMAGPVWRERARTAVAAVLADAGTPDIEDAPDIVLLRDIKAVFRGQRMRSSELARSLMAIEGSPWSRSWSADRATSLLADLLRPFGVAPKVYKSNGTTVRGYERSAFEQIWSRKLREEQAQAS